MRIMTPWQKQYYAILCERREMALIAWKASGYCDAAKHAESLYYYGAANRILHAAPMREGSQ